MKAHSKRAKGGDGEHHNSEEEQSPVEGEMDLETRKGKSARTTGQEVRESEQQSKRLKTDL